MSVVGSKAENICSQRVFQLLTDCVEKVENAASAKFAQKRADRRLRLAMPSQSM
jgi:hypothetical protein